MSRLSVAFEPEAMPATAILKLRGQVSHREAAQLRREVFQALGRTADKNLVVDLSQLESMDTAGMAVLVEALMEARHGEPALFLMCPSEAVRKVFRLAGLEEALTRCYTCWEDFQQAVAV